MTVGYTEVMEVIGTQLDNFTIIKKVSKELNIDSGTMFLPQSLTLLDGELNRNSPFACECMKFLDNLGFIFLSRDINFIEFINSTMYNIAYIRTAHNYEELTIGKETLNDLLFSTEEEMIAFIKANKTLLALYLYLTISSIFYK